MFSLLEELETWGAVLKGEPEVIHKLRELDVVSQAGEAKDDLKPARRAQQPKAMRGPSL